jgi:hypothetical protein
MPGGNVIQRLLALCTKGYVVLAAFMAFKAA